MLPPVQRKQEIAKAAVALGGGIWSMHFIGMLAVSVPTTIRYDALPTLGSVLIAILVTGFGLLVLHFGQAVRWKLPIAGSLVGLGIVSMHYVGMSAISGNCIVAYRPAGLSGLRLRAGDNVVVATQGRRDREALKAALASGAGYLAMVGSRRKFAALKRQLADDGVTPEALARLHGPAGLAIGAIGPDEIALSILAEIVQTRRRAAREGSHETAEAVGQEV